MRNLLIGAAALASMMLLATGGQASPSDEALPAGFNDAVYYSVAIDRPDAQFTPQPI
ncbi:MAG TPA: hypothetical protein VN718_03240 [Rhizomicrobium sp.]|nr:hypothetical protein [Rhizomicrobium sp.]